MKKVLFTFVLASFSVLTLLSQVPQSFKYQAVVRDKAGQVLPNQSISLHISILQSASDGPEVYRELHSVTTSELGLVTIEVGRGKSLIGNMAAIDWGGGSHFLRVEMDPSGGTNYELMGVSELLSVPYALYAAKAGSGKREADLDWEITGGHVVTGHGGSYPAGNVGIGNNAPGTLLYVAKNMGEPTITIRNLGGGGGATYSMVDDLSGADWKFKATTYGGFKIRDHANLMDVAVFEPNSAPNSIYIKSGGNVGIGINNPVTKLDVNGSVKMNGSVVMTGITPGGSSDSLILALNPATNQLYYKYASNLGGGGGGGESNTASNLATGVGVYEQKSGVDLQFNSLASANAILDITENDVQDKIIFTVDPSQIDHDGLQNFVVQKHFYQGDIDTVNTSLSGLVKSTSGVLGTITDNSGNWNTAYGWGNHASAGYLTSEVDGSTSNELQTLSVSGDQLTITSGNTVTVPGDDWGDQVVIKNATLAGNGTAGNPLKIASQGATTGQTLIWDGTTWVPGSVASTGWSLTGNAGTDPAVNFVGTTDNQPLKFKVNDVYAGQIHPDKENTFLGKNSGRISDGSGNTAIGSRSLFSNTTGYSNVAMGVKALYSSTDRSNLVAIGDSALFNNGLGAPSHLQAKYNTAIGSKALYSNITGFLNTATGYQSLYSNVDGVRNSAYGEQSLYSNVGGNNNTAIGNQSLYYNTEGNNNTVVGYHALHKNTTGDNNIATGFHSLFNNTTGYSNVAMGVEALYSNTTRRNLVAIGDSALYNNGTGATQIFHATQNTAIGSKALYSNSTGFNNTATGNQSLYSNTTGKYNTAIGVQSLYFNIGGGYNTATGFHALYNNTEGLYNTAIGFCALFNNTEGNDNEATGYWTLYSNTIGNSNIATGREALRYNTTGYSNVAMGIRALYSNTTRSNLVAVGDSALFNNGTGASDYSHAKYNTAIGSKALYSNTTGSYSTSTGYQSLYSNTIGFKNTATGYQALYSNTEGYENTSLGYHALYYNEDGCGNTASGCGALANNTEGNFNTASGYWALLVNTSGSSNSAFGEMALYNNSTGWYNSAVGMQALYSNTTGNNNVAFGDKALFLNTTGHSNVANGTGALYKNTTRSNLVAVGDSALYNNGQNVSQIYHATENTALGSRALYSNTRGYRNTATGYHTLYSNTTGICNTAIGDKALYSSTESGHNTATGYHALYNTTGSANTAYGSYAMFFNAAGMNATALGYGAMYYSNPTTTTFDNYNVAIGYYSLRGSISPSANTGNYNTALGSQTLFNNTTGSHNLAAGNHALYSNTTGYNLTAMGDSALYSNTEGLANTAVGKNAMKANTTGDYNTAIGRSALDYNTTGNSNTAVGYNAGPNVSNASNTIAIGRDAEVTASNQVRLGNSSITTLYCMGAYVGTVGGTNRDVFVDNNGKIGYVSSSLRYKENIEDMESIDWLYSLRPVNFTYKTDENHLPQVGLIAEEVEQVKPEFVSYDNEGRPETVSYSALISPLLKAVQEQQEMIKALQEEVKRLKENQAR